MSIDQRLLHDSLELVLHRDKVFPRRFYDILFQRHPEVQALFTRNSRGVQEAKLARTLMAIVDHLDDEAWRNETLLALGAQHRAYGVTAEMYEWVADALVAALAEVAADDWTDAHREAWLAAYRVIADRMLLAHGV